MTENKLFLFLKERYPFTCCFCNAEMWAKPSMGMEFSQMNFGGGMCLICKKTFALKIDESNERMVSFIPTDRIDMDPLPDACFRTRQEIDEIKQKNLLKNT